MPSNILIVDDEPYMLELIQRVISENTGHQTRTVSQSVQVPELLDREVYDLILLDLRMPGMDGMALLKEIKRRHPKTAVIIITAFGTISTAVEALQHGAADFITKPFANPALLAVLDRVLRMQELDRENQALRQALNQRYGLKHLIGNGPQMRLLAETTADLAQSSLAVLILGDFGTGRSFFARALHFNGPRAGGPFLSLDLDSVQADEMETIIFGGRGSEEAKPAGLLAGAEGGTLHLAAIERLPQALQNRLALWLEEGRFRPNGDSHLESADVRLVASSHKDQEELLQGGLLSQSLGSPLSKFVLCLPPLRSRREDIPLLAGNFLSKYAEMHVKEEKRLSDEAAKWLLAHDWPGNLRELENSIERAVLLGKGQTIEPEDLAPTDLINSLVFSIDPYTLDQPREQALQKAGSQFEKAFNERYLTHHLIMAGGDLNKAATSTGLELRELHQLLSLLGISPQRFAGPKRTQ